MSQPSFTFWDINVAAVICSGFLLSHDAYKQKYGYLYRSNGTLAKQGIALLNTFKLDLKDYPALGDFRTMDSTALRRINPNISAVRANTVVQFILEIGGYFNDQAHPQLIEFQSEKQKILYKDIHTSRMHPIIQKPCL